GTEMLKFSAGAALGSPRTAGLHASNPIGTEMQCPHAPHLGRHVLRLLQAGLDRGADNDAVRGRADAGAAQRSGLGALLVATAPPPRAPAPSAAPAQGEERPASAERQYQTVGGAGRRGPYPARADARWVCGRLPRTR
ncbi:hypothetical protein, partial [Pandoraea nosoerga]|uniref:hypothetical protein n=1 Tax=Pandoraea nosoerga TaxID=2508296 RepID=UPI001980B440